MILRISFQICQTWKLNEAIKYRRASKKRTWISDHIWKTIKCENSKDRARCKMISPANGRRSLDFKSPSQSCCRKNSMLADDEGKEGAAEVNQFREQPHIFHVAFSSPFNLLFFWARVHKDFWSENEAPDVVLDPSWCRMRMIWSKRVAKEKMFWHEDTYSVEMNEAHQDRPTRSRSQWIREQFPCNTPCQIHNPTHGEFRESTQQNIAKIRFSWGKWKERKGPCMRRKNKLKKYIAR